nr:P-loop NTPase fold protein [Caldisericia bacterium]
MSTGDKKESQQKVFRPFGPLTDPDDDQLGFAPFAEHIARSIVSFGYEENIAISINGAWGSGKTTFLGFVKSYIREHNKNGISVKKNNIRGSIYKNAYLYKSFKWFDSLVCGDTCDKSNKLDNKLILVEFNPWLVVDQNQLINEFFSTLNKALKSKTPQIDGDKLTEAISEYISLLEPVPLVGSYAKSVGGALKVISDKLEKNLNDKKEKLKNILNKSDFKIIFFIDDLDRLFPKEMYLIFQLIKSILDFPNIIYVVAFDSDYVRKSLEKEFSGLNAQEYLKKIFQMPFHIPQVESNTLSSITEKFIVEKYLSNDFSSDRVASNDIHDLFRNASGIFKTYREVTRFLETISFTYPPVKDDVYLVDFIGIELLRIFYPAQYDYIFSNIVYLLASDTLKQIYKNEIMDMYNNIDKYPKQAMNLVYFLFPDIDDAKFHPSEQQPYKSKVGRYIDKSRKACIS